MPLFYTQQLKYIHNLSIDWLVNSLIAHMTRQIITLEYSNVSLLRDKFNQSYIDGDDA